MVNELTFCHPTEFLLCKLNSQINMVGKITLIIYQAIFSTITVNY